MNQGEPTDGEKIALNVFPNPAIDASLTTVRANRAISSVQIISVNGQVVHELFLAQPLSQLSLETAVLPVGLYIVRAFLEQGGAISTRLLVRN